MFVSNKCIYTNFDIVFHIAKLNLNSTQLNSTQTEVEMVYIST